MTDQSNNDLPCDGFGLCPVCHKGGELHVNVGLTSFLLR
jgi:hypothetical protein